MDGQYDIKGSYNTYQQSQQQSQRQGVSLENTIKTLLGATLEYVTKVGVDINPEYGYIRTEDGKFEIVRTDPNSIAFYMGIPDPIVRAIGNMAERHLHIGGLDNLIRDILEKIRFTVIVGNRPDAYITIKQANNYSQK